MENCSLLIYINYSKYYSRNPKPKPKVKIKIFFPYKLNNEISASFPALAELTKTNMSFETWVLLWLREAKTLE
jgi:hypothetical protein